MDVVVDKEAENAVVAREQAMAESRRAAFMKLAERNMSPSEFKSFKPPKDSDLAMLVQDFEVQDEQMSATRYVGTFTVRFRDGVRHYMDVKDDTGPAVVEDYDNDNPETAAAEEDDFVAEEVIDTGRDEPLAASGASRPSWQETTYGSRARPGLVRSSETLADNEPIANSVLILPYFENISGQTLLWEEQNPWLSMWQGALPKSGAGARHFYVPLGDISDIAAGNAAGVWSGDYKAVDTLLGNYGAEQAVLAVANKSGPELTIEIYTYRDGRLRRRDTLKPYVGASTGTEAFRKGIYETIGYLQAPYVPRRAAPRPVEQISRDLVRTYDPPTVVIDSTNDGQQPYNQRQPLVMKPLGQDYRTYNPPPVPQQPQVVAGSTRIAATMQFSDSKSWMDMQRRIAGILPAVRVDISSMSSSSVSFTLSSDAPAGVVKQSLYSRGVELHPPAMEGGAGGVPVYDVRLAPITRQ